MDNEKLLANPNAEEDLFACIFENPRAIHRVTDVLKVDDFYRDRHRTIYRAMLSLWEKERRCSAENVWSEIIRLGEQAAMGDLQETDFLLWGNRLATLQPVQEYVHIISHYATLRRLMNAGRQIVLLAYTEDDRAIELSEKLIYEVATGAGSKATTTLSEALDVYIADLEQRIDDKRQGVARGIPTGFKDLDHMIGGMQPGTLATLGALTGIGKSAWALNLALNVVKSARHALFFSLEMKTSELVQRITSGEVLIDQALLRDADIDAVELRAIKARALGLRECDLKIDDTSYLLSDIKSRIRQTHARKPLDLVVIDYLQLVKTSGDGRNRHESRAEELSSLSREMKRLALDLDIPILILVQLNRNVEHRQDPTPKLADINESGGIARDSDVVMFLYTLPIPKEEEEKALYRPSYPVYLRVEKNRQGSRGEVTLTFRPRITRFEDLQVPGGNE